MNPTVRIRPLIDSLFSGSITRFPEFFREQMRVFSFTVMPLLMSFGLIVNQGVWENRGHHYTPKTYENHWFAAFVETYGILPVVLIALALLLVIFFAIRFLIKLNKRKVSGKMNSTK